MAQQRRQVNLALCVGQMHQAHAARGEGVGARLRGGVFLQRCAVGHGAGARGLQQGGVGRGAQLAIDHHHLRLARGGHFAHVQAGVVGQHGAHAREDGAGAGAPGMAVGAGGGRGDPLAGAVGQGGEAVERGGHFQSHPGGAARHAADKTFVQRQCLGLAQSHIHLHTSGAQPGKALATHQRVGVAHAGYHARNACGQQSVAAGAGAPVVRAGLQRDVGGGAAHIVALGGGVAQRHDFSVWAARLLGKAAPQHLAVCRGEHAAHAGVGVREGQRLGGLGQCLGHENVVRGCGVLHGGDGSQAWASSARTAASWRRDTLSSSVQPCRRTAQVSASVLPGCLS